MASREPSAQGCRALLATSREALLLADAAQRIVWVNDAFERLTGWSAQGAIGQGLALFIDGTDAADREARAAGLAARFKGLAAPLRELPFAGRRADGSAFDGRLGITPVPDAKGQAAQFAIRIDVGAASVADAPDARRLDGVWRRIEVARQMRRVGICEVHLVSGNVHWDENVYEFYGRDPALGPMSTEEAMACIHPEDREAAIAAWDRSMVDRFGEARYRVVRADGSVRSLHSLWRIGTDEDGSPCAAGVLFDDTEAYALAQRLEEEHLRVLTAEAASRAKSEFLSQMSHELRTPLNAILGFAQLLRVDVQQPPSAAQLDRIVRIEQAGWHLLDMIDEVLDLARVEAGVIDWQLVSVDLGSVLADAAGLVETGAKTAGVTLRLPARQDGMTVRADRKRMLQVFVNLLSNAVKYNRTGGHVVVETSRSPGQGAAGDEIVVQVRDTGGGLTPAQRAALFTPFERLGRQHGPVPGTGLGLAIVRKLVHGMGGRIEVESEPGVGSCFSVTLRATVD